MAQVSRMRNAEADLLEIWAYLAEDNIDAADKVILKINAKCQTLAATPSMGSQRDDLSPGIRSLAVGNYVIFYRPLEDGVRIMRVLHGARDLPSQFD